MYIYRATRSYSSRVPTLSAHFSRAHFDTYFFGRPHVFVMIPTPATASFGGRKVAFN